MPYIVISTDITKTLVFLDKLSEAEPLNVLVWYTLRFFLNLVVTLKGGINRLTKVQLILFCGSLDIRVDLLAEQLQV